MDTSDEKVLAELAARLRYELDVGSDELLDQLPLGVFVCTLDGAYTYVNQVFADLLGYEPLDFIGLNCCQGDAADEGSGFVFRRLLREATHHGRYGPAEVMIRNSRDASVRLYLRGTFRGDREPAVVVSLASDMPF